MGIHHSTTHNNIDDENDAEELFGFLKLAIKHQQNNIQLLQNFLLVWLDINIVKDSNSYHETVTPLRTIINTVNTYTDSEGCIQFIKNMGNEKACILISGSIGQHIVPRIHNMPQVDSIFVFCSDISRHRPWAEEWSKINGVFNDIKPVCEAVKQATELCDQNSVSISLMVTTSDEKSNERLDQLDQSFVYTQILKEILLTIEFKPKHITEFSNCCRTLLSDNKHGLKDVTKLEETYDQHSPIWWHTFDYFLRSMLNCAISQINVELIIKLGFFISDLHRQIKQLYNEQFKDHPTNNRKFTVYRGQGMSLNEFEQMRKIKNGLISFNNFLSTTKDCNISLKFAEQAAKNPDLVGIVFNMNIDPSKSAVPFAYTKNVSYHQDKDEILFSMHTTFRIGDIKPIDENHRLFKVDLTLTDNTDERLHILVDRIREETFPHSKGWDRLGLILLKLGESTQSQQIYEMLLSQTTDDKEKALIYNQLGRVKYAQRKYQEAILFHQQSIEIYKKIFPSNHPDLATSHYNMGLVYQSMNEHSKALSSHEKALEIRQQSLLPNHLDLAFSYAKIGDVFFSTKDYDRALSSHEKALTIRQKSLPPNHPDLVSSYDNLGKIYCNMKKYYKAISFYEKSFEIKQQLLPSNHPKLASSYNNIGRLYSNVREFMQALVFYEKALDIFQKVLSPNFSDLVICYGNIGWMHENMGDYLKAYSSYERAIKIGEKSLPLDHPNVQQQRKNLDRVKK